MLPPNRPVFPNYDGNGMWSSMGHIDEASKIGKPFMDIVTPRRIRGQGLAQLSRKPQFMAQFPGCNMVVDVAVDKFSDLIPGTLGVAAELEAKRPVSYHDAIPGCIPGDILIGTDINP